MTTYDRTGRPVQSVDPGLAVVGVAAAGIIGYALADDNHGHRGYYRPAPRPYPLSLSDSLPQLAT